MLRREQKIRNIVLFMVFSILFMGVGYAIFTTNLNVKGVVDVDKSDWNIYFDNLEIIEDTTGNGEATIDSKNTVVDYTINLNKPGDIFSFSVDAVNDGSIDAMIDKIVPSGLTDEQKEYIDYQIIYDDDIELDKNQLLKAGTTEKIKVILEYKYNVEKLFDEELKLDLVLDVQYVKADQEQKYINVICKKATTLHTEECTRGGVGCYGEGYTLDGSKGTTTITYGSLVSSGTLKAGDAFDCDVNGDGNFDEDEERFYYMSGIDGNENSKYAVLVYNKIYSSARYSKTDTADEGPTAAVEALPQEDDWKNVRLSNNGKRIINDEYDNKVTDFKYDSVARLPSTDEIRKACNKTSFTGTYYELENCTFLHEHTNYGQDVSPGVMWLENPLNVSNEIVQLIINCFSNVANAPVNTEHFIRPVIEVNKNRIEY